MLSFLSLMGDEVKTIYGEYMVKPQPDRGRGYLLYPERRHHVDEPIYLALHGLYEVRVAVPEDAVLVFLWRFR